LPVKAKSIASETSSCSCLARTAFTRLGADRWFRIAGCGNKSPLSLCGKEG
jgi:hypothetical protein